jgi:hypothetical protein
LNVTTRNADAMAIRDTVIRSTHEVTAGTAVSIPVWWT